jgi:hypothetical protein
LYDAFHHRVNIYNLPNHHRDPFDRILIAQSQLENLPIMTVDAQIVRYSVDGLITNDKFCWKRHCHLNLSWNERQLRQAAEFSKSTDIPQALEGTVPLEKANETAVDDQARTQGNPRRAKPLGQSVPTSPERGSRKRTGSQQDCPGNSSVQGES